MIRAVTCAVRLGLVVSLFVAGCSPNEQPAPGTSEGQPTGGVTVGSSEGVSLEFNSDPDPLKSGDNTIEVTVKQPDGTAITDAEVTAVFSMPAMPTMNMPAMRSEAKLSHVDGGRYRGMGQLSMAGTWNVTITASRGGQPIGRRAFSIIAK